MDREVEIAGAGLAGMVAAISLAKAGCRVRVYEEKPDVGHRFHGDFQGLENWSSRERVTSLLEALGIGYPHGDFICQPYEEVAVFDADLNRTVIRSEVPLFYLVQRGNGSGSLDRALLKAALEAGVEVAFNKRVDKLEGGGIVGIGPRAADAIAKGMTFDTSMEDMAAAILDDRLAPKGYAYLLIHKGRATLATCMFREFKRERECFERTVDAFKKVFPSLDIKDAREFGGYGSFFFGKPVFENNRYYIGEAAGLQDCLWGFGMRYAIISGRLAAKSIIEGLDYAALLKQGLLPMQRTSLVNRFLFERLGNRGYAGFIKRLSDTDIVKALGKQYNPSLWKGLIYPYASWRYKSRLIDKGCHGEDCACVWCRCGKEDIC